ncbi:MAG: sensor histidine kinase [Chloroflexota bacterium]|nr:sensor histidine kinase [Chloroflexota bacterium]
MSDPTTDPARPASDGRDSWERLLPLWHAVVAAGLSLTTFTAWIQGDLAGARLLAALGVVALLGVGYGLMFVRHTPGEQGLARSAVYLLGWAAAYALLIRLSPAYFWLQPILFSQVFFLVPIRATIVFVALFVAITLQVQVELEGGLAGADLPELIGPVLTIAFFVLLSTWIGKIIEESGERRELIARLESTRRELAERERTTGILEERERMSRELHDTLAQDLIGIVTHLQAADGATDEAVAARHRTEAARMAHEGLAETRRLVWALRPASLEDGTLVESLDRTIERWRRSTGLRATLTVTGESRSLHPDVEIALLRSAQEGLTNAARHAAPRQVTVSLSYVGDVVTLDIHDDGKGFDPAIVPMAGRPRAVAVRAEARRGEQGDRAGLGLGLLGMRERAERLGGSVAIESAPGEGTTLGVTLPAALRPA